VIDLLNDKDVSSVIDGLIPSLIYTEIEWLINPENKRINTSLLELILDGGDYTPWLREFWIKNMEFKKLDVIFA